MLLEGVADATDPGEEVDKRDGAVAMRGRKGIEDPEHRLDEHGVITRFIVASQGFGDAVASDVRGMEARVSACTPAIDAWWATHDEDYGERSTYVEGLVVEVLLQRTRATAVAAMYDAFFQRFPDPASLAAATTSDVETAIRSLGLLWRANTSGARGRPRGVDGCRPHAVSLRDSGVGPYAAGAYHLHRDQLPPFVDANIVRLLDASASHGMARPAGALAPRARRRVVSGGRIAACDRVWFA